MSLAVHPEKHPAPEDKKIWDKQFVELTEAYHRVQSYITANTRPSNDSTDEETHLRKFFEKHNDVKVNIGSCTVILQNGMEQNWTDVLTQRYGEPISVNAGGMKWSLFDYSSGDNEPGSVFITKWDKPKTDGQTKLSIQGKNFQIFSIHQLPQLYHEITNTVPKTSLTPPDVF